MSVYNLEICLNFKSETELFRDAEITFTVWDYFVLFISVKMFSL